MLNGQSQTEVIGTAASAVHLDSQRRSSGRTPRVVIAADGALFCAGLRALIETGGHFQVSHQIHNGADALRRTRELEPDVLLLDTAVPDFPNNAALRQAARGTSPTAVLLLATGLTASILSLAVDIGASGLVLKSAGSAVLLAAIRAVADGAGWIDREIVPDFAQALHRRYPLDVSATPWRKYGLTAREREIVAAVAAASTNKEIAQRLGISETTVKHHLTSIFGKVGVSSRLELARLALR